MKFYADGTLFFIGNDLPELDFADDALWERVGVLPFTESIPEAERVRGLRERFNPEAVLAWMVEGHRSYQLVGLSPPEASRLEKQRHRKEADPLAEFWDDCVEEDPDGRVSTAELYHAYRLWAQVGGTRRRE